jgi:MFS transporter, ACS family, D-galactonate transporter
MENRTVAAPADPTMRRLISFLSFDLHKDNSRRMEGGPMRANDRNRAWIVVALLSLFIVIDFADKAVVGIAAVPIMQELKLGPRQFGLVGSSFFLLFAVSSVAIGFLVNRVQTRWVLLAMGFIWALIQFPMIGSVGFETLVACRIALGAGEGPATPVALHSAYKWFPNERRTLPTAVILQGGAIGVLVALPLLNWVIVRWTWHSAAKGCWTTGA